MSVIAKGRAEIIVTPAALADARVRLVAPLIAEIREAGAMSFAEIARKMNERGSTTHRGYAWDGTQVRRVMRRLKGI